jgi:hypothetical protein
MQAAKDAWEEGRIAFNGYIKTANKGLTLQVFTECHKLDKGKHALFSNTRMRIFWVFSGQPA